MAKKHPEIDENDFEALDRWARNLTLEKMRPLTPKMRRDWEAAKRSGLKKKRDLEVIPTMITVERTLLRRIDATSRKAGLTRSQFLARAARRELKLLAS